MCDEGSAGAGPDQPRAQRMRRPAVLVVTACLCLASAAVIYSWGSGASGQVGQVEELSRSKGETLSRLESEKREILARLKADKGGGPVQSSGADLSGGGGTEGVAVVDRKGKKGCDRLCQTRKALLEARAKIDQNANTELKQLAVMALQVPLCEALSDTFAVQCGCHKHCLLYTSPSPRDRG
eukprot:2084128-Rhodomonas_salina.1